MNLCASHSSAMSPIRAQLIAWLSVLLVGCASTVPPIAPDSYKPLYKRFYYFAEQLKDGAPVEVTIGPGGARDIWGIKLGSESLMTPGEAREARMTNGRWGFALFVGFLVVACWSAREARDLRRRGV